jgi:hypothetical protein
MPEESNRIISAKPFRINNKFILEPLEDKAAEVALRAYADALDDTAPHNLKNVVQEFLSNLQKLRDLEKLFSENGYTPEKISEIKCSDAIAVEEYLENLEAEKKIAPIFKVIMTDNYDRELYDDKLVQDNLVLAEAEEMASKLNSKLGDYSNWWYKVVPNSYELFVYEP